MDIAFDIFASFIALLFLLITTNCLNAYLRERRGWKCFWCHEVWIGSGCKCIPRKGRTGSEKTDGSPGWDECDLDERLYHRARFCQIKFLESRRNGMRANQWCWQAKRDSYLNALRDYMECRKRGIYR